MVRFASFVDDDDDNLDRFCLTPLLDVDLRFLVARRDGLDTSVDDTNGGGGGGGAVNCEI